MNGKDNAGKRNDLGSHSMQKLMTNNSLIIIKSSRSKNICKNSKKNTKKFNLVKKRLNSEHSLSPKIIKVNKSRLAQCIIIQ